VIELVVFFMLSKSKKLNLKFPGTKNIFTDGLFFKTKSLQINFDFLGEANQFAVIVPKKKIALAVNRNEWKRFIYQNLDQKLLDFASNNLRLIIRVKTNKKLNLELKRNLQKELNEISLFIKKNG
jgi:RNase P protein component